MQDSRKYKRFRIHVPVFVSANGKLIQKRVKLASRDISGGGVSFETSRNIPLDADSRLVLSDVGDLPEGSVIEGRVVRAEKNPESGRYTVGVEFMKFVNVTREELLERIEAWEVRAPLEPAD